MTYLPVWTAWRQILALIYSHLVLVLSVFQWFTSLCEFSMSSVWVQNGCVDFFVFCALFFSVNSSDFSLVTWTHFWLVMWTLNEIWLVAWTLNDLWLAVWTDFLLILRTDLWPVVWTPTEFWLVVRNASDLWLGGLQVTSEEDADLWLVGCVELSEICLYGFCVRRWVRAYWFAWIKSDIFVRLLCEFRVIPIGWVNSEWAVIGWLRENRVTWLVAITPKCFLTARVDRKWTQHFCLFTFGFPLIVM